jgi:HprK-related kinase A
LNLSALTPSELGYRLKNEGLRLQTGSFIIRLQTSISSIAESLKLLYSDYPLAEQNDFADFHVSVDQPRNLRRWLKPQVLFLLDGSASFKPLPLDQAFPMFEWGLNWCVSSSAHRYLIIHAAVIEKGGNAAILPAPPGSGKSTLCAALVNRGWRLLSDELALVRISDGKIIPLPRPISLKNQSIGIIKHYVPDAIFSPSISDTMKGTVAHMRAPTDSVARASEAACPAWIIFPKYEAGAPARLEALPQSRAFMQMADNAFNYSTLGTKGFETLAGLIDTSMSYVFTYSALDDAIETFAALKPPASSM